MSQVKKPSENLEVSAGENPDVGPRPRPVALLSKFVASPTAVISLAKFLQAGIMFLAALLLARLLGAEGLGVVETALALPLILVPLASFSLPTSVVGLISAGFKRAEALRVAERVGFCSLAVGLVVGVGVLFVDRSLFEAPRLAALGLLIAVYLGAIAAARSISAGNAVLPALFEFTQALFRLLGFVALFAIGLATPLRAIAVVVGTWVLVGFVNFSVAKKLYGNNFADGNSHAVAASYVERSTSASGTNELLLPREAERVAGRESCEVASEEPSYEAANAAPAASSRNALLGFSVPATIQQVLLGLLLRVDLLLLGWLGIENSQIGQYGLAVRCAEALWLVSLARAQVFLAEQNRTQPTEGVSSNEQGASDEAESHIEESHIAKSHVVASDLASSELAGAGQNTARQLGESQNTAPSGPNPFRTLKGDVALVAFASLAVLAAVRLVVVPFAGQSYAQTPILVLALLPGILAYAIVPTLRNFLIVSKRAWALVAAMAAVVLVNLIGNLITIPLWGAVGAAIATSVSYSALALVLLALSKRYAR